MSEINNLRDAIAILDIAIDDIDKEQCKLWRWDSALDRNLNPGGCVVRAKRHLESLLGHAEHTAWQAKYLDTTQRLLERRRAEWAVEDTAVAS